MSKAGAAARVVALLLLAVLATGTFAGPIRVLTGASFGADEAYLDRAQVDHEHGRLLLALGRRQAAVAHLRAAHERLVAVGAVPFAARVAADLDAAGIRDGTGEGRSPLTLSDRERDVVALVVRGMTNKEVAAELYVSAKTVEYHLGNVYGKLGITSRRELVARYPGTGGPAAA